MSRAPLEISRLEPAETKRVAVVLAEAFLDDPVWRGIGPRSRRHRAIANRASFWAIATAARRNGARIRVARREGRIIGAAIAFEPGTWPLPEAASLWELAWVLCAGPLPVWRGLGDDREMRRHQRDDPHVYLWFLGVDPPHQGTGAGRALTAELGSFADSLELPTRLETATESNLAFYGSLGHRRRDGFELPRSGAYLWQMERPAASE